MLQRRQPPLLRPCGNVRLDLAAEHDLLDISKLAPGGFGMVAELVARPDNFKRSVTFGNDCDHAPDGPHVSRDLPNGSQS